MSIGILRRVSRFVQRHRYVRWTLWSLLIPILYICIVYPIYIAYQYESNNRQVYVSRDPIMANMTELVQKANEANMTITELLQTDRSSITETNDFIDIFFQAIAADFPNKMLKLRAKFIPVGSYSRENNRNLIGETFLDINTTLNRGDVDKDNLTALAYLSTPVTAVIGNTVVKFPAGQPMESREIQLPFLSGDQGQYPNDRYPSSLYVEVYQEPANDTATPIRRAVPFHAQFYGAVQGIHFRAFVIRDNVTNVSFYLRTRRTTTTIVFSIFVCILLWLLTIALGVFWIQLVICGREILPNHLSVGTAILFAMPNIRNSQPGIPSVGVSSDMLGYVWNLSLVTIFTVSIILTYTLRWLSDKKKDEKDKKDKKDAEPAVDPTLCAAAVAPSLPHLETVSVVEWASHQPGVPHHHP
ncbi:hypothetical protein BDF22DRAFT_695876 [Syncephalis plumigaleata]|nr:hypothetical protein BDF22DRAFT_695876 [Syncephalis plumigaleata]